MKEIAVAINGQPRKCRVHPGDSLSAMLRREGYKGVKIGCDEAACGSCTVLLDGRAVYSCHLFAFQADGRSIETIESAGTFDQPHPIQKALADGGAVQCGFCTPGMVLSAKALLESNPRPTDAEMKEHMDGHLCRCTGYEKIVSALRSLTQGGGAV